MILFPKIFPVTSNTMHVGPGSTFVAILGVNQDGVNYIPEALNKGATKIVISQSAKLSQNTQDLINSSNAEIIKTDNPRRALAYLSAKALNFPAKKLKIIAITGTKGKTTTSFLVEHIFKTAGYKTALLSSVKNWIDSTIFETDLTTQHPDYLHVFFSLCVQNNIDIVIMETASQAYSLHRTDNIEFDGLIFTNFSAEHGEFYATQEEYFDAKKALVCQLKEHYPLVINNDDPELYNLTKNKCSAITFGLNKPSFVMAKLDQNNLSGIAAELIIKDSKTKNISLKFLAPAFAGLFNLYNIMAATALTYAFNISPNIIAKALSNFSGVPGRFQKYLLPNKSYAFIDHAHTPSSYEAVLSTLRNLTNNLIVIFGCGGDRDKSKRPVMGQIAAKYADQIILTTDNPRSEEPENIIKDILSEISIENKSKIKIELDREKAIKLAYNLSSQDSIIALLGKGPENYQIIKNTKYPFSEEQILKSL